MSSPAAGELVAEVTASLQALGDDSVEAVARVVRVWADFVEHGEGLSGARLAELVSYLAEHERQVGGPYVDEHGHADLLLNLAVARLFHEFGHPLRGVEEFLAGREDPRWRLALAQWLAAWPDPLECCAAKREPVDDWELGPIPSGLGERLAAAVDASRRLSTPQEPLHARHSHSAAGFELVRSRLLGLPGELSTDAEVGLARLAALDATGEISGLAVDFADALGLGLWSTSLDVLGAANICSWLAYTAYDDLLDAGRPVEALPLANVAHRLAVELYESFAAPIDAVDLVRERFLRVDAANRWEVSHCRAHVADGQISVGQLPDHGDCALWSDRSIVHVLGPELLLVADRDRALEGSIGLRSYLKARQLNDDLHDWREDLRNGHLSPIVVAMLQQVEVGSGTWRIAELEADLTAWFWREGLERLSGVVLQYVAAAASSFHDLGIDGSSPFVQVTLGPIEASVNQAMRRRGEQGRFVDHLNFG